MFAGHELVAYETWVYPVDILVLLVSLGVIKLRLSDMPFVIKNAVDLPESGVMTRTRLWLKGADKC